MLPIVHWFIEWLNHTDVGSLGLWVGQVENSDLSGIPDLRVTLILLHNRTCLDLL